MPEPVDEPSSPSTTDAPPRVTWTAAARAAGIASRRRSASSGSAPDPSGESSRSSGKTRCVGKISSPGSRVETSTTIIHALSSEPSSSWNASAVS